METRSFLSFPRGRTSSSTLPLCAIARPMEPREAMVPSCAEYMSQDLGLCPRKYRIQGLHRTADARLARHRQDITERRKRKDGSGLGLAVLLISVSLGPWPCSGFSPPWSTGASALLAHPVQSQSAATSCNRWPAGRVPNHGGLLSRATEIPGGSRTGLALSTPSQGGEDREPRPLPPHQRQQLEQEQERRLLQRPTPQRPPPERPATPRSTQQRPTQQRPTQQRLVQQRPPQRRSTQQQQQRQQQAPLRKQPARTPSASRPDEELAISIESIATALESGQRQSAPLPPPLQQQQQQRQQQQQQQQHQRQQKQQQQQAWEIAQARQEAVGAAGNGGRVSREPAGATGTGNVIGQLQGGGGGGGGKQNKVSMKKRRARKKDETPEEKRMQNEVAQKLKAGSASGALETFNRALEAGVGLRSNLLCGVLNECAKAGWMDDCMRVCNEMKVRGMVIEENTFVPLIRGMVSQGDCRGALDLIRDMVKQGVQPRLRCYEPVIAGTCGEGDMDGARQAWEHMEQQGVIPREDQYVNFLCGLGVAGELWENARSGKLDDLLMEMSYHARNLTMEQVVQLETRFNAISLPMDPPSAANGGVSDAAGHDEGADDRDGVGAKENGRPLARRVKVKSFHSADDEDWRRGWSDAVVKQSTKCPACGGALKAIGLTPDERARIRDTLFGLAGLQVKKHARSRWTRMVHKNKRMDGIDNGYFSFTDEDQREQLQIFVDWLDAQKAAGKTYTAVIDSANVAYHKGNPWHFSLPQVDLMVQALEAKGERPLVVIAEKYIDRVGDTADPTPTVHGKFKYMTSNLNKAIVKRWRAKSQIYECSDEASDDWYWLYAAVAFDDIPMTVISNDRTRDHRMSLAEPVPFLRWRTTQLAKFELSWGLMHLMARKDPSEASKGLNSQGWPKRPPSVAIQAPPSFTRDIQKSDQGCWHLPAGGDDDWLCVDVPRGLRMGLDTLPTPRRRTPLSSGETAQGVGGGDAASIPTGDNDAATAVIAAAVGLEEGKEREGEVREGKGGASDDKMREVGGLLQSMRVKRRGSSGARYSTQGTVEEAAKVAEARAARAKVAVKNNRNPGAVTKIAARTASAKNSVKPRDDMGTKSKSSAGLLEKEDIRTTGAALGVSRVESAGAEFASDGRDGGDGGGVGGVAGDVGGVVRGAELGARGLQEGGEALRREGRGLPIAAPPAVAGEESGEGREWASMTVVALKEELRKRGLKVSGRKAELVERLLQA